MGCIDVCLEKRRRNSGMKQVLRICVSVQWKQQSESVGWWSKFLLVDCCGWVVFLGIACVEIYWRWTHWESRVRCW